jgi:hypothetical protein
VLAGTITPPSRSPLTANGPTAAQVLQAPPPAKKDGAVLANGTSKEPSSTRGTTPDRPRSPATSTKVCISKIFVMYMRLIFGPGT